MDPAHGLCSEGQGAVEAPEPAPFAVPEGVVVPPVAGGLPEDLPPRCLPRRCFDLEEAPPEPDPPPEGGRWSDDLPPPEEGVVLEGLAVAARRAVGGVAALCAMVIISRVSLETTSLNSGNGQPWRR